MWSTQKVRSAQRYAEWSYTPHSVLESIRKVRSWSEYKVAKLFTRWVDDLWAMRQRYRADGNSEYDAITKRVMNSLYGKFAQLSPQWVEVPNDSSMLPWTTESRRISGTHEWETRRAIGWQVQRMARRSERRAVFTLSQRLSPPLPGAA